VKITAIKKQAKRDYRVSVFVDEKFSFGLSESQLIEAAIGVGDEITVDHLDDLKKLSKIGKLKEMASSWALRRDHSVREIEQYIYKKTQDESEKKELFAYLNKLGFVDDKRFAENWVRQRRNKGMSTFVVRGELYKKGINSEIIDEVVDNEDELDSLLILVEKIKDRAAYKDKQKLMKYLASKGYRYDDIKKALEELSISDSAG